MKTAFQTVFVVMFLLLFGAFASAQSPNAMYQVSTINALLQGVYDGEVTVKELKQHGDFGIGTIERLDGELIALNGDFYQVKSDGQVVLRNKSDVKTPFASVINFKPEQTTQISDIKDYTQLEHFLDKVINDTNYIYAIRIDGVFDYIETRSIPAQSKPYPTLAQAAKTQSVFKAQNVKGTIVGFWCPQYVNGINVPGYHLHFISDDRNFGGHILAGSVKSGSVQIARISDFRMVLPGEGDFKNASLNKDYSKVLESVEKSRSK